jgi:protein lin-28
MGVEATFVAGPGGIECKGSSRRPLSRKKFKKIRSDLVPDNLVYF